MWETGYEKPYPTRFSANDPISLEIESICPQNDPISLEIESICPQNGTAVLKVG